MVYDGTNYINDPAIESYEDVPGIALQRLNGQVRVVLHGSDEPTPLHKETVAGNIEFFNANVTGQSEDNSGNNKLEDGTDGLLDVISFSGDKSFFDLHVDEGDDGFYTSYTYVKDEDCNDDDGGGDGGGDDDGDDDDDDDNNGGGSSGSSSSRRKGEVLGASIGPACIRFTEYYDTGDRGGEIEALQKFLNVYMNAGLVVDGVYGKATTQAVHDFQAMYWDEIIDPWVPPLSPNTTGRFYKTTRATVNAIMGCPEAPVFLEDPMTNFEITNVTETKEFVKDEVVSSLEVAQGIVK